MCRDRASRKLGNEISFLAASRHLTKHVFWGRTACDKAIVPLQLQLQRTGWQQCRAVSPRVMERSVRHSHTRVLCRATVWHAISSESATVQVRQDSKPDVVGPSRRAGRPRRTSSRIISVIQLHHRLDIPRCHSCHIKSVVWAKRQANSRQLLSRAWRGRWDSRRTIGARARRISVSAALFR